jgi:hypothetical protein
VKLNYRERIINNKLRKFWKVCIPTNYIKDDGYMFDKYRTNSFIYYNTIENKNDLKNKKKSHRV